MSEDKKDLTRIEDLSEFLHEESEDEDFFKDENSLEGRSDFEQEDIPEHESTREFNFLGSENPDINDLKELERSENIEKDNIHSKDLIEDEDDFNPPPIFEDEGMNLETSQDDFTNDLTDDDDSNENFSFDDANEELDHIEEEIEEEIDEEFDEEFEEEPEEKAQTENFDSDESSFDPIIKETINEPSTDLFHATYEKNTGINEEEISEIEEVEEFKDTVISKETIKNNETGSAEKGHLFFNHHLDREAISYSNLELGKGPPYSVLLKMSHDLKNDDKETLKEDIFATLRDFNLFSEENLRVYEQSFEKGHILVSQINEYSAIILTHKIKNFPLQISMGLANDIQKPKSYDGEENKGLSGRVNNQTEYKSLEEVTGEIIYLSTGGEIPTNNPKHYLGPIQTMRKLAENELDKVPALNEQTLKQVKKTNQLFSMVTQDLKDLAMNKGGNSVINIKYQITPTEEKNEFGHSLYYLYCFGDLVRVEV